MQPNYLGLTQTSTVALGLSLRPKYLYLRTFLEVWKNLSLSSSTLSPTYTRAKPAIVSLYLSGTGYVILAITSVITVNWKLFTQEDSQHL